MANPTSGFQLSALPQPLSMPSNLGKFDVSQTQQAYSNALKNAQQTVLLKPQTEAAIAQAGYQKGLAEQQSRLLAPEEQALIQDFRKKKILAQTEANVGEALAPGAPGLAVAGQDVKSQGTALAAERLRQAAGTQGGVIPIDIGGGLTAPGIVSQEGGLTIGGGALLNTLATKPSGDITYIKQGAPRQVGNSTVQDWMPVQTNAMGNPIAIKGAGAITQRVELPAPVWQVEGGSALRSMQPQVQAGAPIEQKPAVAPSQVPATIPDAAQPTVAENQIYVPFVDRVVEKDSQTAKAIPVIEKAVAAVNPDVVMNKEQEKRFTERIAQNSDNMSALSSQSLSLQNAKRAFDEVKKSGVIKTGAWWRVLSPDLAALFGEYQGQDFDSAMLNYVEKTTGTLKNIRAYQGVKDLLIAAKPQLKDDPRVIDAKFAYMGEALNHQQDYIAAENYMLEKGVPYSTALSTAAKVFRVSPDGDYTAWAAKKGITPSETAEAKKETAGAATNAPVQLPDTFTKEEFEKLVPVGATYTLKGKVYKRPK
jgi:hypothetical protein